MRGVRYKVSVVFLLALVSKAFCFCKQGRILEALSYWMWPFRLMISFTWDAGPRLTPVHV